LLYVNFPVSFYTLRLCVKILDLFGNSGWLSRKSCIFKFKGCEDAIFNLEVVQKLKFPNNSIGVFLLGIIFTGGKGPQAVVIKNLIGRETSGAFFIAADSGLALAEQAGVKCDFIIGDMDSLDVTRLASYPEDRIIRMQPDKDFTDTELAVFLAVEKGCDKIWIIGGGGGRIDHLFGIRSLFERDFFPHRWITDEADIYCIDANSDENPLSLNPGEGACVSVFPLGAGPWKAKSSSLKWQLDKLKWDRGFFGLSNVAVDGWFMITAEAGRFMVILPEASPEKLL